MTGLSGEYAESQVGEEPGHRSQRLLGSRFVFAREDQGPPQTTSEGPALTRALFPMPGGPETRTTVLPAAPRHAERGLDDAFLSSPARPKAEGHFAASETGVLVHAPSGAPAREKLSQ